MKVTVLNSRDFAETINSEINKSKGVIVDFYADWCGPCQMVGPILEEIAEENIDSISVYKVNVDESQDIAAQFSVSSIPTLISFRDGEVYKSNVGSLPKDAIIDLTK